MLGRHIKGLLTVWMLLGAAIIVPLLFQTTLKGWTGLMIALVAVFICPRLVFYPIYHRGK
jgi:hypothetical protein